MVKLLGCAVLGVFAGVVAVELMRGKKPLFIKKITRTLRNKAAAAKAAFMEGYASGLSWKTGGRGAF